jgi:prolyl 4-hydroxylase
MTAGIDQDGLAAALARGEVRGAVAQVAAAAARGDPQALYQQAIWHLIGDPLPRDLPRSRALLRRAAEAGHADAAAVAIALVANGSGAVADWAGARALLDEHAGRHAPLAAQRRLIAGMSLDESGTPSASPVSRSLVPDGSVRLCAGFATPAECAHVATGLADIMAPASVLDPVTGRAVPHPIRSADEAAYGPTREDLVVRALNLRIAAASGTAVAQGEALTILRYAPGQRFGLHSDILGRTRNQRVATMLLYLNDAFEGGETTFPDHQLVVKPRAGDALLFLNTLPDGRPDPRKRHTGQPVVRGVKWLATRWIRQRPFDPWTGPEADPVLR